MYALKTLIDNRLRFLLTVMGIALCTILMLLLLSIYKGVADGSVEYIRKSDADLWVLQLHSYNILRSNSYLPVSMISSIEKIKGVKSVSPVFFLLSSADLKGRNPSLYITGYDPAKANGHPPEIIDGHALSSDNDIILDRSFAAKYRIRTGDRFVVKRDTLKVAGISSGTNMFVIQYAFVTLKKSYDIAGIRNYVSCFQVQVIPEAGVKQVSDSIEAMMNNVSVFDHKQFLENNIQEMESGILPLLMAVALISAIVLTAVLSLIMTINVLERKEDFAVMKALGAPDLFIPLLVVKQAVILAFTGLVFGILLFFPFARIIEALSPEISTRTSVIHVIAVTLVAGFLSTISSILPNLRLKNIYPSDVFK